MSQLLVNHPSVAAFFKNESPTQLPYCEFCEFFENNNFAVQLWAASSVFIKRIGNVNKPYFI